MTEVRAECYRQYSRQVLTRSLLLPVTSECADNGLLLATETVGGALSVALRLGGLVLGLALGMLVTARRLPRLEARRVADHLDEAALGRVVLTGGLATVQKRRVSTMLHPAKHARRTWDRSYYQKT